MLRLAKAVRPARALASLSPTSLCVEGDLPQVTAAVVLNYYFLSLEKGAGQNQFLLVRTVFRGGRSGGAVFSFCLSFVYGFVCEVCVCMCVCVRCLCV